MDGAVVEPTGSTASVVDKTLGSSMDVAVEEPSSTAAVAEGTRGKSMGDVVQPQSSDGSMATLLPFSQHCTHPPRFLRLLGARELCGSDPTSWSWVSDRNSL